MDSIKAVVHRYGLSECSTHAHLRTGLLAHDHSASKTDHLPRLHAAYRIPSSRDRARAGEAGPAYVVSALEYPRPVDNSGRFVDRCDGGSILKPPTEVDVDGNPIVMGSLGRNDRGRYRLELESGQNWQEETFLGAAWDLLGLVA